ncbi:MAG: hypothetical protein ABJQ14_00685 [Hyphomicrobiales bacterium]
MLIAAVLLLLLLGMLLLPLMLVMLKLPLMLLWLLLLLLLLLLLRILLLGLLLLMLLLGPTLLLLILLLELLLLLRLILSLLLLPTLKPLASPAPSFPSWTSTSTTGRLRTSGVQGKLIYHSLHAQRLRNHLFLYLVVGIRVVDDLIDFGTGDERTGKN